MLQATYLFGKLIIESFSFFSKFVSEMLLSTGLLMILANELENEPSVGCDLDSRSFSGGVSLPFRISKQRIKCLI